jgi:hypothetical protein
MALVANGITAASQCDQGRKYIRKYLIESCLDEDIRDILSNAEDISSREKILVDAIDHLSQKYLGRTFNAYTLIASKSKYQTGTYVWKAQYDLCNLASFCGHTNPEEISDHCKSEYECGDKVDSKIASVLIYKWSRSKNNVIRTTCQQLQKVIDISDEIISAVISIYEKALVCAHMQLMEQSKPNDPPMLLSRSSSYSSRGALTF